MTSKKPNAYIAIVELSQEDIKRVKELYKVWTTSYSSFYLKTIAVDLLDGKIYKEDMYTVSTIRELLHEASSENNSTSLNNVLMCIAKGLYWCTDKELAEANITM